VGELVVWRRTTASRLKHDAFRFSFHEIAETTWQPVGRRPEHLGVHRRVFARGSGNSRNGYADDRQGCTEAQQTISYDSDVA